MSIFDELYKEHKKALAMVRLLERTVAELRRGEPISLKTVGKGKAGADIIESSQRGRKSWRRRPLR